MWVADGARDRVLMFAADGSLSQTVRRVAGIALSRPSGVATSPDGRVWIADTGNSRVAVTSATTADESSLPVAKELGSVDLTDVAVSADGKHLWVVDNDGSRVFTVDPATNKWEAHGKRGTAWGAFNHPRTVAVDAGGSTYVTDVLNGRVQHFDPEGRPMRPIVKYGVSPGQVFRPSGIDEADGKVWVADSVLGVVQVFLDDGTLIDAVRDTQGNVLHLDAPIGVAIAGDRLYVVESRGSKVSEFTIAPGTRKPLQAVEAKTMTATASQGQECMEGDPTNCLRCHGPGSKNQPVDVHPGEVGHALVDRPGGFGPSDPPLNGCTSCHGGHEIVRPDATLCEKCHKEQAAAHARGGHGTATCIAYMVDLPDGRLYCAMSPPSQSSADSSLVVVDNSDAVLSSAPTGIGWLYGVGYADGKLFGFSHDGDIYTLDASTGRATRVASPGVAFAGAATNPWRWDH